MIGAHIFFSFCFLVKYGTTRLKVDPVDGSLSYPEPAPDHGTFHLMILIDYMSRCAMCYHPN